jgi:2-amino-4-hydroxy-6-hydroxymethyldihydropteridine diphosphokinase
MWDKSKVTKVSHDKPMTAIAYLSLGSNVGDREGQLVEALGRLSVLGPVAALSSFYETEPVEFTDQPWFLNVALALETRRSPEELMSSILLIEEAMGRKRIQNKGPRSIDIDILMVGDQIVNTFEVTIPHPAMHERRFVLEPLAEIAPGLRHPVLGKTMLELRDALPAGQTVRKVRKRK